MEGFIGSIVWSADGKSVYISSGKGGSKPTIWKANADGPKVGKFLDTSCFVTGAAPDGKYLLGFVDSGDEAGLYEVSILDRKRIPFAFRLFYEGNAFDFSRDLSTIIYARPGGQADLYLLSPAQ